MIRADTDPLEAFLAEPLTPAQLDRLRDLLPPVEAANKPKPTKPRPPKPPKSALQAVAS